jgi:quercetin dioxygenase-like cupin family protein
MRTKTWLSNRVKNVLFISIGIAAWLLCPLLSAQTDKQSESTEVQKDYNIENCVNEFSMENTVPTEVGYQYWFIGKDFLDGRTIKMSVVEPRAATHPAHTHTEDEIFFILEGKAEFYLNGKTKVTEGYASFYCPANSTHGIKNVGNTTLKYLVIKKYKQE